MESALAKKRITVRELCLLECVGIPHFQRGLVWSSESTALLLESLYLDTPLGTVILWQPESATSHGIKLPWTQGEPKYFVVDGQQRLRTLRSVLFDDEAPSEAEEPEVGAEGEAAHGEQADGTQRVWCLNLARIRELAPYLSPELRGQPMFMKVRDPAAAKARFRHNLVPLRRLRECWTPDTETYVRERLRLTGDRADDLAREAVLRTVKERVVKEVAQMANRPLGLEVLEEKAGRYDVDEVVRLYNRINSAGRRVEAEEKALATLVSIHPGSTERIKEIFEAVHPSEQNAGQSRDDHLQRQKEKHFGFKLFIRVFVQACSHHFNYSPGASSLSFSLLDVPRVQDELREHPEETAKLWSWTKEVLTFVRHTILAERLHCDDLRFCPDAFSLTPLFQLLLKYPALMKHERYWDVLARFTLRLYLAEPNGRELMKLCNSIRNSHTFEACLTAIEALKLDTDKLNELFERSMSLQHRGALLLYWLERKEQARDLSYENQVPVEGERDGAKAPVKERVLAELAKLPSYNRARETSGEDAAEALIDESCEPEKQHLVPYSLLKPLFGLSGSRVGSHEINSVGNLTYISRPLNRSSGLSDNPADLRRETDENKRAHLLSDEFITLYEAVLAEKDPKQRLSNFQAMYQKRTKAIASAFEDWIASLPAKPPEKLAQETLRFCSMGEDRKHWIAKLPAKPPVRIAPETLLFCSTGEDRIRDLGYDDPRLEDALLALLRLPGVKVGQRRPSEKTVELVGQSKGPSRRTLFRLFLTSELVAIAPRGDAGELLEELRQIAARGSGKPLANGATDRFEQSTRDNAGIKANLDALALLRERLDTLGRA